MKDKLKLIQFLIKEFIQLSDEDQEEVLEYARFMREQERLCQAQHLPKKKGCKDRRQIDLFDGG